MTKVMTSITTMTEIMTKGSVPPKNEKVKTFAIRGQTRGGETRML